MSCTTKNKTESLINASRGIRNETFAVDQNQSLKAAVKAVSFFRVF